MGQLVTLPSSNNKEVTVGWGKGGGGRFAAALINFTKYFGAALIRGVVLIRGANAYLKQVHHKE